jgi:hypothetical protein
VIAVEISTGDLGEDLCADDLLISVGLVGRSPPLSRCERSSSRDRIAPEAGDDSWARRRSDSSVELPVPRP